MHSPETQAFQINYPLIKSKGGYRIPFITIWHKDPENDGTDDSCGWFIRSRHGNKEMKNKIRKAIGSNFNNVFKSDSGHTYYTGYFREDGSPNYSTQGIVLNMFYQAAYVYFHNKRNKTKKWMQDNLFDILNFAENPVDSLHSDIVGQFRIPCGETWKKEYALDNYVSIIYGWLLRETRPWYKHPRWHMHHWNLQIHPLQNIKRRFWDKCSVCGKRGFKGGAMSDWNGTKLWHEACDNSTKAAKTETN